jgi:hypothetical protein
VRLAILLRPDHGDQNQKIAIVRVFHGDAP